MIAHFARGPAEKVLIRLSIRGCRAGGDGGGHEARDSSRGRAGLCEVDHGLSGAAGYSTPGIAGSGAIACGIAACASALGEVRLLARSDASAWRARGAGGRGRAAGRGRRSRADQGDDRRRPSLPAATSWSRRSPRTRRRRPSCSAISARAAAEADLATTTSSLGVAELAQSSGLGARLFGFHPFNPVDRMELVELCLPEGLRDGRRRPRPRLVRGAREDRGRGPGPARVRRQPPALPLPVRRGAAARAHRDGRGRGRRLHDASAPATRWGRCGCSTSSGSTSPRRSARASTPIPGREPTRSPASSTELVGAGKLGRKSGAGFYEY